ncbi:hypothetical protein [Candidatus Reidiella endopervernicosa]|uniref:Uncharacterized protein n=1 Tax=Candidatus Reidiella endopervernicosa TaxID=2738883 RepID=A0A6N0HU60_9GAMM|nr:hypothetical protein [Candidatus Reidiella endopervernicosa]QKQ25934.1 hypothetical protein HUE57_06290 [Candidatus Reidiella endopervernicosa]
MLETFNAPGTASLGTNTVTTTGLGDIKFGTIFKAFNSDNNRHNFVFDIVFSAPTGSITEEDNNLTPMNTIVKSRLAYGMQLGSGTWDSLLGVVYWGKNKQWGWGVNIWRRYRSKVKMKRAGATVINMKQPPGCHMSGIPI